MTAQIVSGNEALALGALKAGVRVVTGYPGTPSTRAVASLLAINPQNVYVEWSANEKVAFEIATGAAWAGYRALCAMKMSGLNVAYDSLISVAYSGILGGLVIYVADDPGVNAGMAEQDSRGYAYMSDLPMLEPASASETHQLIQDAFEISEKTGSPVFIRLITAIANSKSIANIASYTPPPPKNPLLIKDIHKFTKAGAAICMAQHNDLIRRLQDAGNVIKDMGLNRLSLAPISGGIGIIASGVTRSYLPEGIQFAENFGFKREHLSVLEVVSANPLPIEEIRSILISTTKVIVLEELEPYIEREVYIQAEQVGFKGEIIGKLNQTFNRVGAYDLYQVVKGLSIAGDLNIPEESLKGCPAESLAANRPITVCAGCPHRGTFMAINQAIRKLRLKKDEVIVTGDIGCTILGMNPPFNTVWNELSMGASVGLAQGFAHAGVKTPIIATMGDSTFFHAGIPGIINAVQHQTPLTLIILDNGWTAMTGMQVNPGTNHLLQPPGGRSLDIAQIVAALGVSHFSIVDPYNLESTAAAIQAALPQSGVKVILARRECTIQAQRRNGRPGHITVDNDRCNLCKLCITITGCPAINIDDEKLTIDAELCSRCSLCAEVCNRDAILLEIGHDL